MGDSALPLSLASFQLVLEIVHRIPWPLTLLALVARLGIHELGLKRFPVAISGFLLDDNLLVIVRELIDDVLDGSFSEFELVECRYALWCDGDTGRWLSMTAHSMHTTRSGRFGGLSKRSKTAMGGVWG